MQKEKTWGNPIALVGTIVQKYNFGHGRGADRKAGQCWWFYGQCCLSVTVNSKTFIVRSVVYDATLFLHYGWNCLMLLHLVWILCNNQFQLNKYLWCVVFAIFNSTLIWCVIFAVDATRGSCLDRLHLCLFNLCWSGMIGYFYHPMGFLMIVAISLLNVQIFWLFVL